MGEARDGVSEVHFVRLRRARCRVACAEVLAAHLGERVREVAVRFALGLQRAGVVRPALVPRVRRAREVGRVADRALVHRRVELVQRVDPRVDVRRALGHNLVALRVGERRRRPEGGGEPLGGGAVERHIVGAEGAGLARAWSGGACWRRKSCAHVS